ncbi:MAG: prephenate dehydrogenase/arogenate dehydrogenase family protein [Planctomycetota bacterium]|nr:MAG: prephenate dehydrogenase/arogenate dehydrogenase family protein [Planctomycetota bacterium]
MPIRVLIDGLGLMGGSLAAALSAAGHQVWLHHRRPEVAAAAAKRGWGEAVDDPRQAAAAEVVVTCVPVRAVVERVRALHESCPRAVITDVGSTKGSICRDLGDLGAAGAFVGSHPMCGSHASGLEHARADLYRGATVVVCPPYPGPEESVVRICELWQKCCGARVVALEPDLHDQAVARASHLPHILSALAARGLDQRALPLAAGGFRDTSRVAAASAPLWSDILRENRQAILAAIAGSISDLAQLAQALEADNEAAIVAWLEGGRERRLAFEHQASINAKA